jgi:hypothetical protein
MNHFRKLDQAVTAQSAKLQQRRQRIQQRKIRLRDGALNFCRKSSTLAVAFVAGAALATLYPPERTHHPIRSLSTGICSLLRSNFSTSLQLLVVNTIRGLLTSGARHSGVEHSEELPR